MVSVKINSNNKITAVVKSTRKSIKLKTADITEIIIVTHADGGFF